MAATVHDISCERERRSQGDQHSKIVAHQWEIYEEVVNQLQVLPEQMLLKVMTACRMRLKEL